MARISHYCQNCGGDFEFDLSNAVQDCPACGMTHARPANVVNGVYSQLTLAHQERTAGRFLEAEKRYADVLSADPDNHEARWGRLLCRYRVEFVVDPATKEEKAIIHRGKDGTIVTAPVCEDADYQAACANAPEAVRVKYEAKAAYIDGVRSILTRGRQTSKPVDVFLCYKHSGPDGETTCAEFGYAQRLYYELSREQYQVFFAHATLQSDSASEEWEAAIHHALYSAKVMLLVCSAPAALQTPWVRSEWRRFMKRIDNDEDCRIIPLFYDGFDPGKLPDDFSLRQVQGLTMYGTDALTAYRTLLGNLNRLLPRAEAVKDGRDETAEMLESIRYRIGERNWERALALVETLIDKNLRCAQAHMYKLLIKRQLPHPDALRRCTDAFEADADWQNALRYASEAERAEWTAILEASQELRRQREMERRAREAREAEERRRAAEARRLREVREAEERRRAEQARREREAREAEERHRAEQARREREAREAEERRRAEQARREQEAWEAEARRRAEEQQQLEKRDRVRALLAQKKWEEAKRECDGLQASMERSLLYRMAEFKVSREEELCTICPQFYNETPDSHPWTEILQGADDVRRQQLQGYERSAARRFRQKGRWLFLMMVLFAFAEVALTALFPDKVFHVNATGSVVLLYGCFIAGCVQGSKRLPIGVHILCVAITLLLIAGINFHLVCLQAFGDDVGRFCTWLALAAGVIGFILAGFSGFAVSGWHLLFLGSGGPSGFEGAEVVMYWGSVLAMFVGMIVMGVIIWNGMYGWFTKKK